MIEENILPTEFNVNSFTRLSEEVPPGFQEYHPSLNSF